MQLRLAQNIDDFAPDDWDSGHDGSFYFRHSLLKVLSSAAVENAEYRYLHFSNQGKPTGVAVLSKFLLNLDLLSGEPYAVKFIKKWRPGFFQVLAVFAGTPGSFGQLPFFVFEDRHRAEIQQLIHQSMEAWAQEEGIKLRIWKELSNAVPCADLEALGYHQFSSLPDMHLSISWCCIEDYIAQMRASYRRKLKASFENWKRQRGFSLRLFEEQDVAEFYNGYFQVMQRTSTRLETYHEEFFRQLALSENAVEILTVSDGDVKISALLLEENEILNFILVSKPQKNYPQGLYNKLLHGAAFAGIEKGKKLIRYGQTSMYSKAAVGCSPQDLRIYLNHRNALIHYLIGRFGKLIFPEAAIPGLNVFKTNRQASAKPALLKLPA